MTDASPTMLHPRSTMTNIISLARDFAAEKHKTQKRKYTGEPYINHCASVAEIVAGITDDPNMIAAAWLHDTIEDTGTKYTELCDVFNSDVADLVICLTDISEPSDGNRAIRKKLDRDHLSLAPPKAKTIKLADLIDNTSSIVEHDPGFARIYLAEKELLLPLLADGNPKLYHLAIETLRIAKSKLLSAQLPA